jgi:hypothetical protein
MKVEIISNNDNNVVGYKIVRESTDDRETIERIRDMYFWDHLGEIKYDGRVTEVDSDDTTEIRFIREDHQKKQEEEREIDLKLVRRQSILNYLSDNSPWYYEELVKLNDDELNSLANTYNY